MQILTAIPAGDGAVKFLFRLEDGLRVEAVFLELEDNDKDSLCISSQVGCALKCSFCSTGQLGLVRNLTADEMVAETEAVIEHMHFVQRRRFDLSYMGMGEPLQNLAAVIESKQELARRFPSFLFHLSTVGLPDQIRRLADLSPDFGLQISLHSPHDSIRSTLAPINQVHPIAEVLAAGEHYAAKSGRKIVLNYCLMAGVNDRADDATALVSLLVGRPFRLQLVQANPHESLSVRPSGPEAVATMLGILQPGGIQCHYGRQLGGVVGAGCGQLDADYAVDELKVMRSTVARHNS